MPNQLLADLAKTKVSEIGSFFGKNMNQATGQRVLDNFTKAYAVSRERHPLRSFLHPPPLQQCGLVREGGGT
jgi:hypothetical protein